MHSYVSALAIFHTVVFLVTITYRWRGNDIVFSTEDCLVCALPVKSERRARPTRADPLTWVLRTPTPLHGMRPHPQIRHGPFFAVSADMRVLQVGQRELARIEASLISSRPTDTSRVDGIAETSK